MPLISMIENSSPRMNAARTRQAFESSDPPPWSFRRCEKTENPSSAATLQSRSRIGSGLAPDERQSLIFHHPGSESNFGAMGCARQGTLQGLQWHYESQLMGSLRMGNSLECAQNPWIFQGVAEPVVKRGRNAHHQRSHILRCDPPLPVPLAASGTIWTRPPRRARGAVEWP
jgi:hypothetical protein